MATQWRSGSVFAFHDVSHYGRCDEALNAFKEGFFHILVMTEEEGISKTPFLYRILYKNVLTDFYIQVIFMHRVER